MMPIRYHRAKLARELAAHHPGHPEFVRERMRAFDLHNGRDKMIPTTSRPLKPCPYSRPSPLLPRDRAPLVSG
jgi:hypothetical protein